MYAQLDFTRKVHTEEKEEAPEIAGRQRTKLVEGAKNVGGMEELFHY